MPPTQEEVVAARAAAMYEKNFVPSDTATPEARSAAALEYMAYQVGVMRRDISALRAAVEAQTKKP